MHVLSIVSAIRKGTVKELKDFFFEKYYQRMVFDKENSYYSVKHQEKKIYNCLQQNEQKKYLTIVILKETINHF